ncbi:MAG: hypothetical protein MZV64_19845 [Ignavibacteriales bacterium]|nr:hypothetical protein [Ignavibacteriales bacterium]
MSAPLRKPLLALTAASRHRDDDREEQDGQQHVARARLDRHGGEQRADGDIPDRAEQDDAEQIQAGRG